MFDAGTTLTRSLENWRPVPGPCGSCGGRSYFIRYGGQHLSVSIRYANFGGHSNNLKSECQILGSMQGYRYISAYHGILDTLTFMESNYNHNLTRPK